MFEIYIGDEMASSNFKSATVETHQSKPFEIKSKCKCQQVIFREKLSQKLQQQQKQQKGILK